MTQPEWNLIAEALDALPSDAAAQARGRVRDSIGATRPVVCPLLDTASGACLIYAARPVFCRSYGFYAERQYVLGCGRIEAVSRQSHDVIWGNHETLEQRVRELGPAAELSEWLNHR